MLGCMGPGRLLITHERRNIMGSISKAIAAGVGGAAAGAGTSAYVLPDGSPWYAYVIMAAITAVLPAVLTYYAPKNSQ